MFGVLTSITVSLVVLGIIIVIHEAGHFLVAKLFHIRVETFSVGFGPRLFGYQWGETDYRISALPLGGYVKMSGENPGDDVTGDPNEFMSKPKWQRFLVAFAGPLMNGVLAVGLLAGLYMYGVSERRPPEDTLIGIVAEGSPAEAAGMLPGDRIVQFDGEDEFDWRTIELEVLLSPDIPFEVQLERNGEIINTTLTPERQGPREIGFAGMSPDQPGPIVTSFRMENSPAELGGLEIGDQIIAVEETDLRASPEQISQVLQDTPGNVVALTVIRNGETVFLDVELGLDERGNRALGIQITTPMVQVQLGPIDAVTASLRWNAANAVLIFDILGRLIRRETSMRSMDGPIGIVNATGRSFEQGIPQLIQLMVIISLNLGVINLLPIPILDGGVMLLLVVEGIMRQDLSMAIKERIAQVSFVFLLTLIVFVLYNDVVNISNQVTPG
jgi:regulator of sigma E protease